MSEAPSIVHVEINQLPESSFPSDEIEKEVSAFLYSQKEIIPDVMYSGKVLPNHVAFFRVCPCSDDNHRLKLDRDNTDLRFYVYQSFSCVPEFDTVDGESGDLSGSSSSWSLPNVEFEGLWESLVLSSELKNRLMDYVRTALIYSQNQVSSQIIRWNSVVLLHGPPGTGKTSLCRALAQKLSIRLSNKYRSGQLVEINAHSLFSKWFSESPKLVLKFFNAIKQTLEFEENFVCILLDEVESLTYARKTSDSDPVDAIRVVNAVLTQLDQLQRYRNVLILATSNISDAIDIAFADRADLKLYLGYPEKWGIYEILRSCMEELFRCQMISGNADELFEAYIFKKLNKSLPCSHSMTEVMLNSNALLELSAMCNGLSGRTLRKLPFLTSASIIDKSTPNIQEFLSAMKQVIINLEGDNKKFFSKNSYHLNNGID